MRQPPHIVANLLRDPAQAARLTLSEWDAALPTVRRAGLTARLAHRIEDIEADGAIPQPVWNHLHAARILADKHRRDVEQEVDRIALLLSDLLGQVVFLKGAAYVAAELPPAIGRIFNDIDILVPRDALEMAEGVLGFAGWRIGEIDPYDELYYRRWMHQLPPLHHAMRGTVIDVHHTITPTVSISSISGEALLTRAQLIDPEAPIAVLSPADMVLHSAVHLFDGGEYARALRDLDDLNLLLAHFGKRSEFFPSLHRRARELRLCGPLFYAVRYAKRLFETPIPPGLESELAGALPRRTNIALMDALYDRALRSPHPACRDAFSGIALSLLYTRGHSLRMPVRLLLPHLLRKSIRRFHDAESPSAAA